MGPICRANHPLAQDHGQINEKLKPEPSHIGYSTNVHDLTGHFNFGGNLVEIIVKTNLNENIKLITIILSLLIPAL